MRSSNPVFSRTEGFNGAAPVGFDGFVSREGFYWLTLAIVMVLFVLARGFIKSPMGTAIVSARG